MPVDITRILRTALSDLQQDKQRIDRQIAAIETALPGTGLSPTRGRRVGVRRRGVRRRRRRMSAAARRAVGRRMKAYWAKRRESQQAAKAEQSGRSRAQVIAKTSEPAPRAKGRANATRQKRNQEKRAA
jgi:hypothetical protein